jgi:hypothetical protein
MKTELTYEERIAWFVENYYESGLEYQSLLVTMKDEDLDNFKWYDDFISIPKHKVESKFGTYMETESTTKLTSDKITRFVERLKKIGIDVKLTGNFPWVYIDEICGIRVTESFAANHGFTLIFLPGRNDSPVSEFTDIEEIFKLIRKYVKEAKFRQTEKIKAQIEVLESICDKTMEQDDTTKYFVLCELSDLKMKLKEIKDGKRICTV